MLYTEYMMSSRVLLINVVLTTATRAGGGVNVSKFARAGSEPTNLPGRAGEEARLGAR